MNPTDCIFCQIVEGTLPTQFVYQSDRLVAFKDIHPQAPVHLLIVPKAHIRSINDLSPADAGLVGEMALVAQKLAASHGIAQSGYRLIFNVERGGGQLVFHLHLHLMGGWDTH